ncbi:signal recognition particle-docking protein FtsY [Candidatus Mycoplasma haematolamae str. Purdue]|uniref:Signal recognition particle-docking protein FtsY n=1 Tax=Mycoplasma haematolamae (strain Purdue) TaxID=1212765 RepID=I7CKP9_MYCHA|nr:cell division protein FtsY [Candidatus Mycoplasma haematolamae]AFO52439.1 signal recognition particle-docking protein FtsY [Candidatus Mycoplasma haematolamae str. Purdue]
MSFFNKAFGKLKLAESFSYISGLFKSTRTWDAPTLQSNLRELLIKLDFQLDLATELSSKVVEGLKEHSSLSETAIKEKLKEVLVAHYSSNTSPVSEFFIEQNSCNIFFIIGSNGVGKTSFIAKLVNYVTKQQASELRILLVASDTFRAGAVDQIEILGNKLNVEVAKPNEKEGAGALIYRTLQARDKYDLMIYDSSGRQYNNKNLMAEIQKQYSIIEKLTGSKPKESFLVLDSTLGTYAHQELEKLLEIIPITGLVLTKMDNTARGGVIYNLKPKFSIPIRFICFGEDLSDIDTFEISTVTNQLIESVFSLGVSKS